MHIRIAGEDRGHHEVVRRITQRRLLAEIPWLAGVEMDWRFEKLTDAPKRARSGPRGFGPLFGHFGGEPGKPDAHLVRYQLAAWAGEAWDFDAAIIARDTDRRRDSEGAKQALIQRPPPRPIALAYAVPEVEAWIIAGLVPSSDPEREAHRSCRQHLGFDPCENPHELASTNDGKRDAKRVCAMLIPDRETRYDRCLDVSEEVWARRTNAAGGRDLLDDLTGKVVPALRRRVP